MSDVASLKLCKELYALSQWETGNWTQHGKEITPKYTLGYLLRKLPHFIEVTQLSGGYTPDGWVAVKKRSQDYNFVASSGKCNTPEDAACKLAIELWKQGVFK